MKFLIYFVLLLITTSATSAVLEAFRVFREDKCFDTFSIFCLTLALFIIWLIIAVSMSCSMFGGTV